jgi:hypothetical protein
VERPTKIFINLTNNRSLSQGKRGEVVEQLMCGVDHPPPSSAEVRERVELYLYSLSEPSWSVVGWTYLTNNMYTISVHNKYSDTSANEDNSFRNHIR